MEWFADWMTEWVVVPFLFIVAFLLLRGAMVALARAVDAEWVRRTAAALRSGRRARVPTGIRRADRSKRGCAVRDGEDVHVIAPGHHLIVDRQQLATAHVSRESLASRRPYRGSTEIELRRGLVGSSGTEYWVGPPEPWADVFRSMLEGPARPLRRGHLVWLAAPRTWLSPARLFLAAGLLVQGLWMAGSDQVAVVGRVWADEKCWLAWETGVGAGSAEVWCPEPLPRVGDQVAVHVLPVPFEHLAWDVWGYQVLIFLTMTLALFLGMVALGLGMRRAWRAPVRLGALTVAPRE